VQRAAHTHNSFSSPLRFRAANNQQVESLTRVFELLHGGRKPRKFQRRWLSPAINREVRFQRSRRRLHFASRSRDSLKRKRFVRLRFLYAHLSSSSSDIGQLVTTSSTRYEAERQLQLCRQNVEVSWRDVLQYLGTPFFIGVELHKRTFCARPIADNCADALPVTLRGAAIKL
jgi:hypothetical protein